MAYDYSKLKGRIIEKYGSFSNFANALGKSLVIVSKKLNNKSKFSREAMLEWAEKLDIDISELGAFFLYP